MTGEPSAAPDHAAGPRQEHPRLHRLLGAARDVSGTVYGTIVVMATIVAASTGSKVAPWRLAVLVASTVTVLWLAHAYAEALDEAIARRRRLDVDDVLRIARHEGAVALAAAVPIACLLVGAAGIVRETAAVWLALWAGVGTLALEGLRYARVERLTRTGTAVAVAGNLVLGLALVALKAAVGH